jgi:hypothetical protein
LRPVEEQGYLIPALNTDAVDYVACAVRLAQSIRQFHPDAKIAVMTLSRCSDPVFDHVVSLPYGDQGDGTNHQCNDWQVFRATPFRETIKLEADMLITSNIDHWWTMFRHRDVVVSTGCRNWRGEVSTARNYREIFDNNNLPDVYNAITYWRLSETAKEFFDLVRDIFSNWAEFKTLLKFGPDEPDTDLVYAIAAQIIGSEKVIIPFASYPQIVHMKRHHTGTQTADWTKELVWENNPLRIQTVAQWGAFHYHVKDWQ